MQDLTKTIKLRLYVDDNQIQQLQEMTEQYRQACNFVSQYIFDNDFELNSNRLNKALYQEVRGTFGLKSQLAQSVFRTATACYKTVKEQLFQHPYKYKDENGKWQRINKTLEWLWKPIVFRRPQADLVRNRDYSFIDEGNTLSINTLGKRIKVSYAGEHFAEYLDGSWSLGTGKLVELNGLWYFHVPVTKAVEEFSKDNVRHVVGIDRGLRFLTVAYDEQGETTFQSGKQILRKRHKFLEVRKQLQSKGTKSAKRALKRISGRENRWMSDVNHQISKTLVEKYGAGTLFVLEDLTGVSFEERNLSSTAKQNYDKRSWAFYQLEQFLAYKAHENQSEVLKVSAQYTSQRCPKCGAIHKENRHHDIHEYICNCGYRSNDDRIGAMNIQLLGTLWVSGTDKPKFEKVLTTSE
ncbi:transposase [uncultured Megasphaera sp.]|jgi:putative transposase|uniref:transposase n=1 Tax=uncultured Megasphaera sp. TaxID=165188 RepID=UPI0020694F78|nr:transposase [uncultured Megasphaera sp.]DAQ03857.1 MAG TPA: endonuclease [Caudoviricetes sp.]